MENGKERAYPCLTSEDCGDLGLTKREHFAVIAMQGLLSNPNNSNSVEEITKKAVIYSDAILKQLDK